MDTLGRIDSAPGRNEWAKTAFDFAFASVAVIVLAPALAGIALAIRLSSEGPVLYRQRRHGKDGRLFTLFKFRTMRVDADTLLEDVRALNEAPGPVFSIRNDPRVVPGVGAFLRRSNLDELPQLFNVLRGEMSIVGPRPHESFVVEQYEPWQRDRLRVKPGLTCTWQVARGRHQVPFEQWMEMDVAYVDRHSLLGDCRIIARTVRMLLRGD